MNALRPCGVGSTVTGASLTLREKCQLRAVRVGTGTLLLVLAIILLIIAIAGGVIIHPIIFALAIVALVLFFTGR